MREFNVGDLVIVGGPSYLEFGIYDMEPYRGRVTRVIEKNPWKYTPSKYTYTLACDCGENIWPPENLELAPIYSLF